MQNTRRAVSLLLLVVFSGLSIVAAPSGAMLYVSGRTVLNGMQVGRSSAVFLGDEIKTSEGAAATLSATGSTIVLAANSSAVYQGQSILLKYGGAAIKTTKGMRVKADTITVSPVSESAKFEIVYTDGSISVTVLAGAVTINDGSTSSALAQGQSVSIPHDSPNQRNSSSKRTTSVLPSRATTFGIIAGAGAGAGITAWVLGAPTSNVNPE